MTPEITLLDNGLRVVTQPMASEAVVTRVYVGVGARHETRTSSGASHFLEHILFKGTESRRSETAIAEAIEGLGGSLNAATSREFTYYWNRLPSDALETGVEVIADQLRRSLFEPGAIDREKKVVAQEMRRRHDQPGAWVGRLLGRAVYGDHPLGWDILGTPDSLAAFDGESLRAHVGAWYVPNNMVLSVAGRVESSMVLRNAERFFGDMEPRDVASFRPVPDPVPVERVLLDERALEQMSVAVEVPGIAHRDRDRLVEVILDDVLGGGMSARLFREVREKRGLAYSVSSDFDRYADAGTFTVAAGVAPERLVETVAVVLEELERLATELVPADELERAKRHAIGMFRLAWETSAAASARAGQLLTIGRIESIDEVVGALRAVTAEDVRRLAQRIFRRDRAVVAAVGPWGDAEPIRALLG